MSGSFLQMLELAGPEAVLAAFRSVPRAERDNVIREVCGSGFPATETLEEFVSLVATPARQAVSPSAGRPRLRVIHNDRHLPARKKGRHR
jgi:hypothetical protein